MTLKNIINSTNKCRGLSSYVPRDFRNRLFLLKDYGAETEAAKPKNAIAL